MIITHPFLFNCIVVLFIAFTSGWIVSVVISRSKIKMQNKIDALENEREQAQQQILQLEEQLEKRFTYPLNSAPVIRFSASVKASRGR